MEYTEHQKAYIDSVDGMAHMSAIELIGLLDANIAELEAELAAMAAERDSESRWAKQYADEADELRQQLAAAQGRISNALKICNSDFHPLRVYDIKKTLEATNDKEIR